MVRIVLFSIFLLSTTVVLGQRTCGTDELLKQSMTPDQIRLQKANFESWLLKQSANKRRTNALESLDEVTIYKIPVVVHIIHQGEPEGTGFNISDEQVFSQIEVINQDFRRLNADTTNTPANFKPFAADIGFEFVLAKTDPQGYSTNGITRTNGSRDEWFSSQNTELKGLSYWPSEDYVNIWVANLSDFLGYAEFPTSTIIPGVNEVAYNNPLTDGVVVQTTAFGSEDIYFTGSYKANYNLGRTLTHELGHYFGLRHVWGDGGCEADDYVNDTPRTSDSYSNCPSIGSSYLSCENEPSMFMNYMDYPYDACTNLFSLGQKDRMVIVVNNSPRRLSLLTSPGLVPPPPLEVGITTIKSPGDGTCGSLITPVATVYNNGDADITELQLSFAINGLPIELKTFTLNLLSDESIDLQFSDYNLTDYGAHEISFEIVSVNNGHDDNPDNDFISRTSIYSETLTTLDEQFGSWPESWAVRSDAPVSQWNFSKAPNLSIQNTAAMLSYYNNSSASFDQLISPILDLSGKTKPFLVFDYAYASREAINDVLAIVASTDCGNNFTDTLFIRSGVELSPTDIPVRFTPSGPVDWKTQAIDLSAYANSSVQLAFIGSSMGGNNIYLDNFFLKDNTYQDIAVKGLENETGVFMNSLGEIGIVVENSGVTTINDVAIELNTTSQTISSASFNNLNLLPGERTVLDIPGNYSSGVIDLQITTPDDNPDNNTYSAQFHVKNTVEEIPFRENFEKVEWNDNDLWSFSTPGDNESWIFDVDKLSYDALSYGNRGLHKWLIMPPFDLSSNNEAGLRYQIAYPENNYNDELFRIWVSDNGGKSFDYLMASQTSTELSTTFSAVRWTPITDEDWKYHFIDLSEFAGEKNIMIGFELTDGDGNFFFLDNVELFVSGSSNLVNLEVGEMAAYPNPVADYDARISFNLDKKQDLTVRILDVRGNIVSDQLFSNVLNQTFPLEIANQRNGMYIVNAIGPSFNSSIRVLVNR